MDARHTVIDSPLGTLTLVARDGALAGVYFERHRRRPDAAALGPRTTAGFEEATWQLAEYFAGKRLAFDLPLAARGPEFDRRVWDLVARVPYGQTRTYGHLAGALGNPALARAVGAANARNPLSVIVPCHRLVGSTGALTGYAGGLAAKRYLLDLEATHRRTRASVEIPGDG